MQNWIAVISSDGLTNRNRYVLPPHNLLLMTEDYNQLALEFIGEQEVCTLATASDDSVPEAATIRFSNDEEFNFYINSGDTYRKYQNMKSNPRVAIVVNGKFEGDYFNMQLEGEAHEVPYNDADYIMDMYKEKYGSSEYLTNDESVFFEIDVDWARLLVDGSFPPEYKMIVGKGDTDPHNQH